MTKQAKFHREQAARMRHLAKSAPTAAMRKKFEEIAAEYDNLAEREVATPPARSPDEE